MSTGWFGTISICCTARSPGRNERIDDYGSAAEADCRESTGRRTAELRRRHHVVPIAGFAGGGLAGESRAREKARQRDVLQRQSAHQSHQYLRGALQAVRL